MARVAVKSKPITTVGDARRVSKSFALKFLRKAFVGARIQRVETPEGTKMPPEVKDLGPIETWQVWATGSRGKQGVIEVTAPRDMLPYAVVREAYRCRLQMDVTVEAIKGGVRLTAAPLPPPPEVKKALEEVTKEIEASGGTVEGAIETIKEEAEKLGYVAGLTPAERETIREKAKTAGAAVVFEDEVKP